MNKSHSLVPAFARWKHPNSSSTAHLWYWRQALLDRETTLPVLLVTTNCKKNSLMSNSVNTRGKQAGFSSNTWASSPERLLSSLLQCGSLQSFVGNCGNIRGWLLPSSDRYQRLRFLTRLLFSNQIAKNKLRVWSDAWNSVLWNSAWFIRSQNLHQMMKCS